MEEIFTEIMNLIEQKTDMPLLEKDIEEWLEEDKENIAIFTIYNIASKSRDGKELI